MKPINTKQKLNPSQKVRKLVNSVNQVTHYWKAHVFPFLTKSHQLQSVTYERRNGAVNVVRPNKNGLIGVTLKKNRVGR